MGRRKRTTGYNGVIVGPGTVPAWLTAKEQAQAEATREARMADRPAINPDAYGPSLLQGTDIPLPVPLSDLERIAPSRFQFYYGTMSSANIQVGAGATPWSNAYDRDRSIRKLCAVLADIATMGTNTESPRDETNNAAMGTLDSAEVDRDIGFLRTMIFGTPKMTNAEPDPRFERAVILSTPEMDDEPGFAPLMDLFRKRVLDAVDAGNWRLPVLPGATAGDIEFVPMTVDEVQVTMPYLLPAMPVPTENDLDTVDSFIDWTRGPAKSSQPEPDEPDPEQEPDPGTFAGFMAAIRKANQDQDNLLAQRLARRVDREIAATLRDIRDEPIAANPERFQANLRKVTDAVSKAVGDEPGIAAFDSAMADLIGRKITQRDQERDQA